MPKFRKRPVEVEAMHFNDLKAACHIWDWANGPVAISSHKGDDDELIPILEIETLEGTMVAALGDWVIKGVKGEFYPCKPEIFAATYDPVTDQLSEPDSAEPTPETERGKKLARW